MRAEELTRGIIVNKESMARNAGLNGGLDNTENIMMKMADRLGKDVAHSLLYEKAMLVEREGQEFIEVLMADPIIQETFSENELRDMLKPENYIGIGTEIALKMARKAREAADLL
jgi:adenylosuccinate lyase